LNELAPKEWIKFTKSWFVFNPPVRARSQMHHPAKYPEGMVRQFIEFFTKSGDRVLDPFAGVGSTLAACCETGRRALGIEINPEFIEVAKSFIGERAEQKMVQGDARRAAQICRESGFAKVQMVITSPPYWDMLRKSRGGVISTHKERKRKGLLQTYSDNAKDLGNIQDYDEFLKTLHSIFRSFRNVLDKGRYMVIILQNIRVPQGEVKPLAWDLTKLLSKDFTFKGEKIWLQDDKKLGIWGYPSEFVTNVHHHYCLIFKNDK
jgi:DNA modification methylase